MHLEDADRAPTGTTVPRARRLDADATGWTARAIRAASVVALLAPLGCGSRPAPDHAPAAGPSPTVEATSRVYDGFDPDAALAVTALADRSFRVRGNDGYRRTLEHVRQTLDACDLSSVALREHGEVQPTWTPHAARVSLVGEEEPVIAFATEQDRDRATLLVGSDPMPATELELLHERDARAMSSLSGKAVLISGRFDASFAEMVVDRGAAGILVRNLEPYHQREVQLDAAQFGYLPAHERPTFGFSLSQRAFLRLSAATEHGPARIVVEADVTIASGRAGYVEAVLEGDTPRAGDIVFVAHADEPGANDNASGVGAVTELACALGRLDVPRRRGLVFLIGQEMEVSTRWLAETDRAVGAGLVLDMVGEDPEVVGAPFLVERMPDPGAIWLRPPDQHSEWGASEVDESDLRGHFLHDLVLAAAHAVAERAPGFRYTSNPFEGGSDHVPFLHAGLPAVLGWHFTDSAYHTTLDRMDRVSGEEIRRVAAAFGGAALIMARGTAEDGRAVLAVVEAAASERLSWARAAATDGDDPTLEAHVVEAWLEWYDEALASVAAWWPDLDAPVADARARLRAR